MAAFPRIVRLDLRTWSGNIGMMAFARQLGFQEEAHFRYARIVDGRYYDASVMASSVQSYPFPTIRVGGDGATGALRPPCRRQPHTPTLPGSW